MAPVHPEDSKYDLKSEQEFRGAQNHRPRDLDEPTCKDTSQGRVLFPSYQADSGPISTDNLLGLLRDRLCDDSKCNPPAGIKSTAVMTATEPEYSKCEITVGLDGGIEAYAFRQTDPIDDLKHECIDSINMMISAVDSAIKECWWTGDREYQMYQAGFRSLNAHNSSSLHISQGKIISSTLPSVGLPAVNTTSQSSKASAFSNSEDPDKQSPMVAGIVIGVLAFVILSVLSVCCYRRRKKEKERRARKEARRAARSANSGGRMREGKHDEKREGGDRERRRRKEGSHQKSSVSSTLVGSSVSRPFTPAEAI